MEANQSNLPGITQNKNPVGRPLALDVIEVQAKGEQYFRYCDDNKKPYTITGLALACGFNERKQFIEYEARPQFSNLIKKFRSICEQSFEQRLVANNPAGSIFWLKNYGWTDQTQLHVTGSIEVEDRIASARNKLKASKHKAKI